VAHHDQKREGGDSNLGTQGNLKKQKIYESERKGDLIGNQSGKGFKNIEGGLVKGLSIHL